MLNQLIFFTLTPTLSLRGRGSFRLFYESITVGFICSLPRVTKTNLALQNSAIASPFESRY